MKAFIGLLILCGTYSTHSASVGVSLSSICADQNDGVFLPVAGDCSQFYICLNGKEVLQSCGVSMDFDPENNRCIETSKSRCVDGLWIGSSQAKTDDLEKVEEVAIPLANICQGKAIGTFLPSRTSCSEFYVCIGNIPILKTCNVGHHYDVDARACIDEKLSKCVIEVEALEAEEIENQLEVNIPVEENTHHESEGLETGDEPIKVEEVVNADETENVEFADIGNNFDAKTDVEEVVDEIQHDGTDHIDVENDESINNNAIETDIGNVDTDEAHIVGDIKETVVATDKINDFIQTRIPLTKYTQFVSMEQPGVAPVDSQVVAVPIMEKIEVSPVDQIDSIKTNALPVIAKPIEEVELPVAEEPEVVAVDNQDITVPIMEKTDVSPVKETDIIPIEEIELPVAEQPEDSPIDNQLIADPIMENPEASLVKQIISMKKTGLPLITKANIDPIEEIELPAIDESEAAPVDNMIIENPKVSLVEQIISTLKHTEESHIDKADVIVITKDDEDKLEMHDTGVDVGYVNVNHEQEDDNTEVVLAVIDEDSSEQCVGVGAGSFFPKAGNCREFITCQSGVAYVGQCPAGLHFNADLKVCDWPELAGCEDLE